MLPYTIDEIKRRVVPVAKKYELAAVYLFGSYARGEATADSDVDLLVDLTGSVIRGMNIGSLFISRYFNCFLKPLPVNSTMRTSL